MTAEGPNGEGVPASDPLAFLDDTFARYRPAALALARRILGNVHLAEDAVQLAFVQILVRVRSGDVALLHANPRAVVLRGTRWAALKLAERDRDRHNGDPLEEASAAAVDAWERADARLVSQEIVANLPPHYRDALALRFLEDQPDHRAAAQLALTVKAYRRRLDRALAVARVSAARTAGAVLALRPRPRWMRVRSWHLRIDARLRQVRARLGGLFGSPGFTHWAVLVAVAGISAQVLVPVDSNASATAPRSGAVQAAIAPASAAMPQSTSGGGVEPTAEPLAGDASRPTSESPSSTPGASSLLPLLDPPPFSSEQVVSVVPAPHYEQNHVILAQGYAGNHRGGLYQSSDGGATWQASTTGTLSGRPILPPDYPQDPRILFDLGQGKPLCLADYIGATMCTPLPVFSPGVFSARFDSGNPVVYGMEADNVDLGFVAYNVATHQLRPITLGIGYDALGLRAPDYPSGPDVYLSVINSNALPGLANSGPAGVHYLVEACDPQLTCQTTDVDKLTYLDQLDRDDTTGRVLTGFIWRPGNPFTYAISVDEGRTFPLAFNFPMDSSSRTLGLQVDGDGGRVALLREHAVAGTERMDHYDLAGHDESLNLPTDVRVDTDWYVVVPLRPTRLMAYLVGGTVPGYWCSTDGGHTWQKGCPPDR